MPKVSTSGQRLSRATNADVARVAAVSPATVSRVMNGHFGGKPEVAQRVREAAADLGYTPNLLARSLVLGRTNAVALLVPDLANPAFQQILAGLSRAAAVDGHRVLVADSAESLADEPPLALETRRRCDALVLCAPRMPDEELESIIGMVAPVVLINRSLVGHPVSSVAVDYATGAQVLAHHLYDLGHRRMAFLEGSETSASNLRRLQGLAEFEAGADGVELQRLAGGVTLDAGREAAARIASAGVTAVLAFNDLVAIGLIQGLSELGFTVPEDVSVTGFDDIPFARYNAPPLTTAAVPYESLGMQAWTRLRAAILGDAPEVDFMVNPDLVVRASTSAPGHR